MPAIHPNCRHLSMKERIGLSEQQHLPAVDKSIRCQPIEIDAARNCFTGVVSRIPRHNMVSGFDGIVDQRLNLLAEYVKYLQPDNTRLRQTISNLCARV